MNTRPGSNILMKLITVCTITAGGASVPAELMVESNADGLLVSEDSRPVLQFQLKPKSLNGQWQRNNYVHPLYDLQGDIITEDFPDDHRHHRGIFSAWHQVWVGDIRAGDPWACKDFVWDIVATGQAYLSDSRVAVSSTAEWKSPNITDRHGKTIPFVSEHTVIIVHPATVDYRLIDFEIRLKALVDDVRVGGSEDEKGYGGFSPRIRLRNTQKFLSAQGEVEPKKTAVAAGPWMNIADSRNGLAVLQHSTNPGYPQPWILRRRKSMQNAVWPGHSPVSIARNIPTVLRYRLVVHRGTVGSKKFNELQRSFETEFRP